MPARDDQQCHQSGANDNYGAGFYGPHHAGTYPASDYPTGNGHPDHGDHPEDAPMQRRHPTLDLQAAQTSVLPPPVAVNPAANPFQPRGGHVQRVAQGFVQPWFEGQQLDQAPLRARSWEEGFP
jgi:hypothetical protein